MKPSVQESIALRVSSKSSELWRPTRRRAVEQVVCAHESQWGAAKAPAACAPACI